MNELSKFDKPDHAIISVKLLGDTRRAVRVVPMHNIRMWLERGDDMEIIADNISWNEAMILGKLMNE
jgi:hypothetical protein